MGDEKPPAGQTSEQAAAAADTFRRRLEDIYGGPLPEPQEPPPPSGISLSSAKTEYQKFCDSTGGPIEIDGFAKIDYRHCCQDFPKIKFRPIIERWQEDQKTGIRHWPAMAFAANDYRFRQQQFASYGRPPSQSDIRDLLSTIARSARELHTALTKLQGFASQLNDGAVPLAIPHLVWIDQYIAQAAAGVISKELVRDPDAIARIFCERTELLKRIIAVDAAASTVSIDRLDTSLLKRPTKVPENRALRRLVSIAKPIWKSLTGRPPSTNKLSKKTGEDESLPDFVRFVRELAEIGGGPIPTFKQVVVAFKLRPVTSHTPQ
jgi:hypothetical protein